MARKTIFVSDISGKEIRDDKDVAQVVIKYGDARRGQVTLDVLASAVGILGSTMSNVLKDNSPSGPRCAYSPS